MKATRALAATIATLALLLPAAVAGPSLEPLRSATYELVLVDVSLGGDARFRIVGTFVNTRTGRHLVGQTDIWYTDANGDGQPNAGEITGIFEFGQ